MSRQPLGQVKVGALPRLQWPSAGVRDLNAWGARAWCETWQSSPRPSRPSGTALSSFPSTAASFTVRQRRSTNLWSSPRPWRSILRRPAACFRRRVHSWLVNCRPGSLVQSSGGPCARASSSASRQNETARVFDTLQARPSRLPQSMSATRDQKPARLRMEVRSVAHPWGGRMPSRAPRKDGDCAGVDPPCRRGGRGSIASSPSRLISRGTRWRFPASPRRLSPPVSRLAPEHGVGVHGSSRRRTSQRGSGGAPAGAS